MKILFLDCDGVLNSQQTFKTTKQRIDPLDDAMVKRVQRIRKETGCKVVLSSVWRKYDASRKKVHRRIRLLDVTPNLRGELRGEEIKAWLDAHTGVTRYAILDDDSDMLKGQPLFQTTFKEGLTEEITQQVIKYLNAPYLLPEYAKWKDAFTGMLQSANTLVKHSKKKV